MPGEPGGVPFCLSVLAFQNFLFVYPPYHKGQYVFKAKPTDVKIWYKKGNTSQVTMKLRGKRYPTDIQRTTNCYQNIILDMLFSDFKSSSLKILLSGRWVQSEEWQPLVLVEKTLGKIVRKCFLKPGAHSGKGRGFRQLTGSLGRWLFLPLLSLQGMRITVFASSVIHLDQNTKWQLNEQSVK